MPVPIDVLAHVLTVTSASAIGATRKWVDVSILQMNKTCRSRFIIPYSKDSKPTIFDKTSMAGIDCRFAAVRPSVSAPT